MVGTLLGGSNNNQKRKAKKASKIFLYYLERKETEILCIRETHTNS
jgi:hypothetical protein